MISRYFVLNLSDDESKICLKWDSSFKNKVLSNTLFKQTNSSASVYYEDFLSFAKPIQWHLILKFAIYLNTIYD